ncbi:DUF2786 domain-containing protein [Pseudonocardia sp. GCM10023141]|uniref:DUF2786 domain-containing protein n=1 Tax=Pseudonocardia sp. GCM10023141 TaxID=3252653 RepID=UPI00360B5B4F
MGADKLDTVRKLLAKADRAATAEEAATYTDKAVELMARHGIDAALLADARPEQDEVGALRIAMEDPYSGGKARLLAWIAAALRCRSVMHAAWGGRVEAVTVIGFASDRERVELLYTSLLLQAGSQLARQRPHRAGESVAAYRRSWLHGFAVEVHRRLDAAESLARAEAESRRAHPSSPAGGRSVALVLADRSTRVEQAFTEAFPSLGAARRQSLTGSGFPAGTAAGRQADIGQERVPPRRLRAVGA